MPRDYAKQKNKNNYKASSRASSSKNTTPLWLFAGILIGLFIAGIAYLNNTKKSLPEALSSTNKHETLKNTLGVKKSIIHAQKNNQPQFDFYTILPKTKVWVPPQTEKPLAEHKPIPTPSEKITLATPFKDTTKAHEPVSQKPSKENKEASAPQNNLKKDVAKSNSNNLKVAKNNLELNKNKKDHSHYLLQVAAFKNFKEADELKAQLLLSGFPVSIKPISSHHKILHRIVIGPYTSSASAAKAKKMLAEQNIKSVLMKENAKG